MTAALLALPPVTAALMAPLKALGFRYQKRARGWFHRRRDLAAVHSLRALRVERISDGLSWTFGSIYQRPDLIALDLAAQLRAALEKNP